MTISPYYLIHPLPEALEGLAELALDLRWSWSHSADVLWEHMAPEVWEETRNPWLILQTISVSRLEELAHDPGFKEMIHEHLNAHQEALKGTTWFEQTHPKAAFTIAYFSMEFGLSEALPIYSGGLGILAGDHLKTASDLGVPVVGVGLLYQQGYFRQTLDARGAQMEFYPYNDPSQLPILPVRDAEGEWLRIEVEFPGRRLRLRAWGAKVGRVFLYLLDSNDPLNTPSDRGITSELYGGGNELRLQQEMALGIGGWRLLKALGIEAEVCHLNEGHAAFAILERARTVMIETGATFSVALAATRAGNLFTTHTPVDAGFDRFSPGLAGQYLGAYAEALGLSLDDLLALGRQDPSSKNEPLNMAYFAARGAGSVNGVSRLHGEVSRRIFQPLFPHWPQEEVPISYVTNGVHTPSWDSAAADTLWSEACGKERWLGTLSTIEDEFEKVPDEALWALRSKGREQLIHYVRERLAWQLEASGASAGQGPAAGPFLNPHAMTIGFARRFATYKRPNLLLHDQERLMRILCNLKRPVQFLIAGKAHPQDKAGKEMIFAWSDFIARPEVRHCVIFLADYDMVLAEQMVQGVDLWINTPLRPWEACGTSGMKVLVNGGLNLSELDGWWAEAYSPEVGWALGDGQEHGNDPAWDAHEAERLYGLLEEEVIPCFYDRDGKGIPTRWISRMRKSMAELTPRFSTNRMLREYVENYYLPAGEAYRRRIARDAAESKRLFEWQKSIEKHWQGLRFQGFRVQEAGNHYAFTAAVELGELDPGAIAVQLYAEPAGEQGREIYSMTQGTKLPGEMNGYQYMIRIPARRPAGDYTPRVIPAFGGASVPLEAPHILWYR
jgi:glycogen phosphorylase